MRWLRMPVEVWLFIAGLIANIVTVVIARGTKRVDMTQIILQEHSTRLTKLESAFELTQEMIRRSEVQYEKLEAKLDRLLDRA